jgi:hypothetical protein
MADYGFDGMIKASFVSAIANVAAPTTTELNAGVPLEAQLTADGLAVSSDTASVDTSKLNSTSNSEIVGRDSFTAGVTYVRGSHAYATAIQTALVRGASGYLVVRRDVTSSDRVGDRPEGRGLPGAVQAPNPATPAANALQTVEVGLSVTDGGSVRGIDNPATVA